MKPPSGWAFLSFGWVNKPISDARKGKELSIDELYLPDDNRVTNVFNDFEREWKSTQKEGTAKRPLLSVLLKIYGRQFFIGGMFKLFWSMLVITGAFYFVRSLLLYINPKEKGHPYVDEWTGFALASGFFVAAVIWGTRSLRSFRLLYVLILTRCWCVPYALQTGLICTLICPAPCPIDMINGRAKYIY